MFLNMLNIVLPDITLLVTHAKEVRTYVHMKTETPVLTTVLFILTTRQKQSKDLSINKQINKCGILKKRSIIQPLKGME